LLSGDWSVGQAQKLNALPKDAVWRFINNLQPRTGAGELCDFKFAKLRHSEELSLVVSDDGGGTADCNDVEIYDKTPIGIKHFDFIDTGATFFDNIRDINGDGRQELIVDKVFAPGGEHQCTATWPVVYASNGTGYGTVSAESKAFYRQRLADLQRQIASLTPAPVLKEAEAIVKRPLGNEGGYYYTQIGQSPQVDSTSAPDNGDGDCLKAEAAKIERFIGTSTDAG